jgi:hypothetical protein
MLLVLAAWTLIWPIALQGLWIYAAVARTGVVRNVLLAGSVTLVAGIGLVVATIFTFKATGLGFWPPPDREFVDRFGEHRSEFLELRDAFLADVRPFDAEARPATVRRRDLYFGGWLLPMPPGSREVLDRLGVTAAYAEPDGRWLCLVLWDGQYRVNPCEQKGLLFVRPSEGPDPDVAEVVETLGDGWYVFER